MTERINWRRVWAGYDKWWDEFGIRYPFVTAENLSRRRHAIQRLVNAELRKARKEKKR